MWQRLPIPAKLHGMVWRFWQEKRLQPSHRHVDWEINLVLRGNAAYLIGPRRVEIHQGSAIWLFPHQEHLLVEPSPDLEMWVIVFRPVLFQGWRDDPVVGQVLRHPNTELHCKRIRRADVQWLSSLARDVQTQTDQPLLFNAGLHYLFGRAWQAYQAAHSVPDSDEVHPAVERATFRLAEETDGSMGDDFALSCGLSRARLSRLFKQQMKVSLATYRNQRRIQRFHEIFQNGKRLTLLEAALQAGFGSYAQFHRVYRAMTGESPRERLEHFK